MGKSNNQVSDLLTVTQDCFVRQRKVSVDSNDETNVNNVIEKQSLQLGKTKFSRSESLDSELFLTPPSSPCVNSPRVHFPPSIMFGQQGASLAGSFVLEQEMGLCKLKQE